jgi:hypothetical protein
MKFCTLLVGVVAVGLGFVGLRLQQAGILDFARLIYNQAYPTGDEPTHLKGGRSAWTRQTDFLPKEDLEKWIETIHANGYLAGGYPRRPHPSSFGEAFETTDGTCPFLYEVDESGTKCSLFNHIDLITYQIFIGGSLSLKFSVKALMAMITQYMIKIRTPMQEAQRYNDTAIDIFKPLMEDERIHDAVRKFTGKPIVDPPFPAHISVLPPGTLLHDHLDQPNFRGMDDPRVPRWLIKVMGYSGLFEHWRIHDCTFLLYFTQQKGGQMFAFADGVYKPPTYFEAHENDAWLGYTGDMWHGIRMVDEWGRNPYDMGGKSIKMLSNMTTNPWTMRVLSVEARTWGVFDGERLLSTFKWEEMRAAAQLRYRVFANEEEHKVYTSHSGARARRAVRRRGAAAILRRPARSPPRAAPRGCPPAGADDLTVEQVTDVLLNDLIARGRLSSKEIAKDKLAKVRAGCHPRRAPPSGAASPVASGRALARACSHRSPSLTRSRRRFRVAPPQMLVSEYLRFPLTNASFPLNYCLVYDFMPTVVQQLMSSHCMTI